MNNVERLDDGLDRRRNDPIAESRYRSGDHGYRGEYGSRESFKIQYRDAFRNGYEQGYRDGAQRSSRPWWLSRPTAAPRAHRKMSGPLGGRSSPVSSARTSILKYRRVLFSHLGLLSINPSCAPSRPWNARSARAAPSGGDRS